LTTNTIIPVLSGHVPAKWKKITDDYLKKSYLSLSEVGGTLLILSKCSINSETAIKKPPEFSQLV